MPIEIICKFCGKKKSVFPSRLKYGGGKYCSPKCVGKAQEGENNPMYGTIRRGEKSPFWRHRHTEETKEVMRQKALKRPFPSEEIRKKLATWKGRTHSEETKEKMSQTRKTIWKNQEFREKMSHVFPECQSIRPNGLEKSFDEMTPKIIQYVGNGKWWRLLPNGQRKNPDFKVINQNKVIELWGDFWHRNENPQDLIDLYKQVGLDCLIFWEHEIYNEPDKVLEKTMNFISTQRRLFRQRRTQGGGGLLQKAVDLKRGLPWTERKHTHSWANGG